MAWIKRKYIFEGKSIHQGDCVNVLRCLDITFVDYVNETLGTKLYRSNPWKVFWMGFQVMAFYFLVGVPSQLKMKWHDKKYLTALSIIQWYIVMWVRYLVYERPEKHILVKTSSVKFVSMFDRKRSMYSVNVDYFGIKKTFSMHLVDDQIFDTEGRFNIANFKQQLDGVKDLKAKKTD